MHIEVNASICYDAKTIQNLFTFNLKSFDWANFVFNFIT